jgi:hypothetical protein
VDPRTLVSRDQIAAGEDLFRQLRSDGLVVSGAMWAQADDDSQPYLYVVTTNIDSEGGFEANLRLGRSLRAVREANTDPFRELDLFSVRLLPPREPLAGGLLSYLERYPDDQPTFRTSFARGVPIRAAYIYPAALFAQPAAQQPA